MNKIFFLLLTPLFLLAKVHYAKVEPYDSVILKSSVSGQVVDVALESEGTMIHSERVIHLDDRLDKVNLKSTEKSITLVEQMLKLNQEIATSLKSTVERQKGYYTRISKLNTASKTQKDNAYNAFTSAKTQYLGIREKIISLEKQILDMQYKVQQLEDSVTKKSIILVDKYLYKLMVREGDFVAPGVSLAKIEDVSHAKLVLFLDSDEVVDVLQKSIYLDDKKTEYKVAKVWKIADEKFISSYRAEIIISAPKSTFSKLLKVEIK